MGAVAECHTYAVAECHTSGATPLGRPGLLLASPHAGEQPPSERLGHGASETAATAPDDPRLTKPLLDEKLPGLANDVPPDQGAVSKLAVCRNPPPAPLCVMVQCGGGGT